MAKLIKMYSKYFAGRTINLPHIEAGTNKVVFDAEGYAKVPAEAAEELLSNVTYSPFVSKA